MRARAGHVAIESRLNELEGEWSRNRVLEIVVACTVLIGVTAAYFITVWGLIVAALAGLLLLECSDQAEHPECRFRAVWLEDRGRS